MFDVSRWASSIVQSQRDAAVPCADDSGRERLTRKALAVLMCEVNVLMADTSFFAAFAAAFESPMEKGDTDDRNAHVEGCLLDMRGQFPMLCHVFASE